MSRFSEMEGEEAFQNSGYFWQRSMYTALHSKRGHAALAELREALMALPEHRLIAGALCTVGFTAEVAAMPKTKRANYPVRKWHYQHGEKVGFIESPSGIVEDYQTKDAQEWLAWHGDQGEGVCAIGAYVWYQKVKAGMAPDEAFAALPRLLDSESDGHDTALTGQEVGLTWSLAWQLAEINYETYGGKTPEERFAAFITWIDQMLARPTLEAYPKRERKRRTKKQMEAARAARDDAHPPLGL